MEDLGVSSDQQLLALSSLLSTQPEDDDGDEDCTVRYSALSANCIKFSLNSCSKCLKSKEDTQ